jgi:hypothetical protein
VLGLKRKGYMVALKYKINEASSTTLSYGTTGTKNWFAGFTKTKSN